jgi:hypothetical protein
VAAEVQLERSIQYFDTIFSKRPWREFDCAKIAHAVSHHRVGRAGRSRQSAWLQVHALQWCGWDVEAYNWAISAKHDLGSKSLQQNPLGNVGKWTSG